MSPITLHCIPNRSFPNLDFPPTYPLDLDGPYTLLTAPGFASASSTTSGHPLAFPAEDPSMIHRNWRPNSWDITGYCESGVSTNGAATTPGPVTGGTTFISGDYILTYFAEFQGLTSHPVKAQPDFSDPLNDRTMISWGGLGDGDYPDPVTIYGEGAYPVLVDEMGNNATGCYLGLTFSPFGTIEPYFWWRGSSYLQHDFQVNITSAYYFSPGNRVPDSWFLDEGQDVGPVPAGWESLNTLFDRVASGSFRIQDTTGFDPESDWGAITMYTKGGTQTFSCDLTARVRSNFLPPTFG